MNEATRALAERIAVLADELNCTRIEAIEFLVALYDKYGAVNDAVTLEDAFPETDEEFPEIPVSIWEQNSEM